VGDHWPDMKKTGKHPFSGNMTPTVKDARLPKFVWPILPVNWNQRVVLRAPPRAPGGKSGREKEGKKSKKRDNICTILWGEKHMVWFFLHP